MNADIFAEWLRRQGNRVVCTPSSYWYEAAARVYQAFPYHWVIDPSEEEIASLLLHNGAIGLRYSTPLNSNFGRISYHAVIERQTYTLEGLGRGTRQNVRTGLRNCTVRPISFECLAEDGWRLEKDTVDRQGRHSPFTEESWRNRCQAASDLPGFEAWGAFAGEALAATLLAFRMEDCYTLISQQCDREFLNARANNALTFTVTSEALSRPEIRMIFYTLHSLDAPPSIDEFKFRMGYVPRPVRQRVVFHPWAAPFLGQWSTKVIRIFRRKQQSDGSLAKAEGMLQFYLEGLRPLSEQTWPDCLEGFKAKLD
jgi:hypothetical protein